MHIIGAFQDDDILGSCRSKLFLQSLGRLSPIPNPGGPRIVGAKKKEASLRQASKFRFPLNVSLLTSKFIYSALIWSDNNIPF